MDQPTHHCTPARSSLRHDGQTHTHRGDLSDPHDIDHQATLEAEASGVSEARTSSVGRFDQAMAATTITALTPATM